MLKKRKAIRRRTAKVLIGVGGAAHRVVESAEQLGFDAAILFDASHELLHVVTINSSIPEKKWSLAAGETVATLLAASDYPLEAKQALAKHPGIGLNNGLGQVRMIGHLAGASLAHDAEFRRWLKRELLQKLLMHHPAGIECFELYILIGAGGATGSAAHVPLVDAIKEELSQATGSHIHVRKHLVGPMSYLTLGDRIWWNAGATTAELTDWVASTSRRPRESRMLSLVELPPCQQNAGSRDTYAILTFTGTFAHAVESLLDRIAANESLRSPIGAVIETRTNYFNILANVTIAENAARVYLPQLRAIRQAPVNPQLVRAVRVELQTAAIPRIDVETILDEESVLSAAEVIAAVCAVGEHVTVSTWADLISGDSIALDCIAETYLGSCHTPKDFQNRLTTLRSIRRTLIKELTILSIDRSKAISAAEVAVEQLRLAWESLEGKSRWSFLISDEAKESRFLDAARQARMASDVMRRRNAEHRAFERAEAELADEVQHFDATLEQLQLALEDIIPNGDSQAAPLLITPIPLDRQLKTLLDAAKPGSQDNLFAVACRSTDTVTLAGLAVTLGAPTPRLEDVVEAIRRPQFDCEGPVWGGQPKLGPAPLQITVLPPVGERLAVSISQYFRSVEPDQLVVFADTAQAGAIGAVRLNYDFPRTASEVVTPLLRHAIVEALADEPLLVFPRGTDYLTRLELQDGDLTGWPS